MGEGQGSTGVRNAPETAGFGNLATGEALGAALPVWLSDQQQQQGPPGARWKCESSGLLGPRHQKLGPGLSTAFTSPPGESALTSLRPPRRGARVGGRVRVERVVCWALQMLGFERAARHPGDCARHAVIPGLVSKGNITFLDRNLQDPGVWNKSPQMCLGDMWIILR